MGQKYENDPIASSSSVPSEATIIWRLDKAGGYSLTFLARSCWLLELWCCPTDRLSVGLFGCPHNMTAGFRQSRSKGEQTAICFTILLQKSYPVFSTIPDWLSRSPLVCVGREYTRAWIPGGRITREHLGVRWPQGSKIIPISQQSKLRHRKVSPFSQRHAADVWRSWDVNPGLLWSSTTQRQCWSLDND